MERDQLKRSISLQKYRMYRSIASSDRNACSPDCERVSLRNPPQDPSVTAERILSHKPTYKFPKSSAAAQQQPFSATLDCEAAGESVVQCGFEGVMYDTLRHGGSLSAKKKQCWHFPHRSLIDVYWSNVTHFTWHCHSFPFCLEPRCSQRFWFPVQPSPLV